MAEPLTIRPETGDDCEAIAGVIQRAFGSPAEARLVDAIRASPEYLAELALVATLPDADSTAERIVGHVMISRCLIEHDDPDEDPIDHGEGRDGHGTTSAIMLSPLAVEPELHRRGIGTALVEGVTARAAELGHPFVLLEGDPRYYGRFGFVPAATFGLELPLPDWAPPAAAQILVLDDAVMSPAGRVVYPPSFDVLDPADDSPPD